MLFKLSCSIDLFKIFASINALKFSFAAYTRYITNIKQIITSRIPTPIIFFLFIVLTSSWLKYNKFISFLLSPESFVLGFIL